MMRKMMTAIAVMLVSVASVMAQSNFPHGLTSQGVPILGGGGIFTQGKSFFLDPVNGNDSYSGTEVKKARKTFANAYKLLTANKNDVLYYFSGSSGLTSTCTLHMDKAMTHLVGVCAPAQEGQRARIFFTELSSVTPAISVTANGCSIRNIYLNSAIGSAGALVCGYVSGNECYFENVNFRGPALDAAQDITGNYSLTLNGAVECTFRNCVIGNSGYALTAGATLSFDTNASRNKFIGCTIYSRIGHASTHPLVLVVDASGIDGINWFEDCTFQYTSESQAYSGTSVFSIPDTTDSIDCISLKDCYGISGNTSDIAWDSASRDTLSINMSSPTAAGSYGKATQ